MPVSRKSRTSRDQVFISYSHKDKKWLDCLQLMLKPLIRNRIISIWDDTKITPGTEWRKQITTAVASAKVAVMLVSPDFLASDFIARHELPPLLDAAKREGLTIIWIAVRHSMYQETEIEKYQAANNPQRPLSKLKRADQEQTLLEICGKIKQAAINKSKQGLKPIIAKSKTTPAQIRKSRKKSLDSIQLQELLVPAIIPRLVKRGHELEVTNIGITTAMNIEIDPIGMQFSEVLADANIMFDKVAYLRPGDYAAVKHTSRFGEKPTGHGFGLDWLFHLTEEYAKGRVFSLRIQFQDILGRKYVQLIKMGAIGCVPGPVEIHKE